MTMTTDMTMTTCPHCGELVFVDLPAGAEDIAMVHASLRYANRTTCPQCDRDFSFQVE